MYQVEIVTLPGIRVAAIQTGRVFERLMAVEATTGLLTPDTRVIGVFYDDPAFVSEAESRVAACVTVPSDRAPSGELTEAHIEGGRYQTWLPNRDEEPRDLPCIEEYLNNARQVPATDLETAVTMPLVG